MSDFESLAAYLGRSNLQSEPWVDPTPDPEQWPAYVLVRRGPIGPRLRVKLAHECVARALKTHWQPGDWLPNPDQTPLGESLESVQAWLQKRVPSVGLDIAFEEAHFARMEDLVDEAEGCADDLAGASVVRSVMHLCSAAKITARAEAGQSTDADLEVAATFAGEAVTEARDSAWVNLEGDEEAEAARSAEAVWQAKRLATCLLDPSWTGSQPS